MIAASPATTRDRLLLAAEELFAERGIDAVSLAEITKAAGSNNTGAVHHHFGGREELLAAVVEAHRRSLDARREDLLDELGSTPPPTTLDVVRCLVLPMVELLDEPRGRAYLSIAAQRALRPRPPDRAPRAVVRRVVELEGHDLRRPPVAGFLADLAELTAISALAQRARVETEQGRNAGLGRDEFVRQLLTALTRIVTPTSEDAP
jgi:AcrR family transcriptional regulator